MDDNDRNVLVQQRIKKMLENKKRSNNRESGEITKRLKSNLGEKVYGEEEEDLPKPNSSMRLRRPTSAMKPAESAKTITANVAVKNDIDVRPVITFVFEHGAKLKELLKQKRLNRDEFYQKIGEDELFVLRLMGILREYPEENWNDIVQKMCLTKIAKLLSREELLKRCEESEKRVSSMIEERLKNLSSH